MIITRKISPMQRRNYNMWTAPTHLSNKNAIYFRKISILRNFIFLLFCCPAAIRNAFSSSETHQQMRLYEKLSCRKESKVALIPPLKGWAFPLLKGFVKRQDGFGEYSEQNVVVVLGDKSAISATAPTEKAIILSDTTIIPKTDRNIPGLYPRLTAAKIQTKSGIAPPPEFPGYYILISLV